MDSRGASQGQFGLEQGAEDQVHSPGSMSDRAQDLR